MNETYQSTIHEGHQHRYLRPFSGNVRKYRNQKSKQSGHVADPVITVIISLVSYEKKGDYTGNKEQNAFEIQ